MSKTFIVELENGEVIEAAYVDFLHDYGCAIIWMDIDTEKRTPVDIKDISAISW